MLGAVARQRSAVEAAAARPRRERGGEVRAPRRIEPGNERAGLRLDEEGASRLRRLYLARNFVGDRGALAVARAVETNRRLVGVRLCRSCTSPDSGVVECS